MPPRSRDEFKIAIICALPLEADAVEALFDEHYDELGHIYGKQVGDPNIYITGRVNNHDVVLAYMPGMGNRRSASVARGLLVSFTRIKLTLLVGICGGVPYASDGTEIVLGDIIISDSVIEYDFGRQYPHGFERKSGVQETLTTPNQEIQSFLNRLRTRRMKYQIQRQTIQYLQILQEMEGNEWNYPGALHDSLFEASYRHKHYNQQSATECICAHCHSNFDPVCQQALKGDCKSIGCAGDLIPRRRLSTNSPQPIIHIGAIASANSIMKSGEHRDQLAEKEGVIGFEMEGAGIWDILPCVIIKGVCDYADSHKNKAWQNYAAATAASCAKCILAYWDGGFQQQRPETPSHPKAFSTVLFQGEYDETEAMHQRALACREKVLGAEHPHTLCSLHNLGFMLEKQRKYEDAEAMYRQALLSREKVLGAKHPDTLCSLNNLGWVLKNQRKYEDAEAIFRRVVPSREEVLGAEHLDTLGSVNDLGSVLECQGKFEDAEAMYRRAILGREKVLGAEHPHTLCSLHDLGLVLERQGKFEDAEAMYRQALLSREKVLGAEHPDTLCSLNNLGWVLKNQRKYEDAEAIFRQVVPSREEVLGAEHLDTLGSVNDLGSVFECQGKFKDAEAMYRRAVLGREKVLGAEHPDTLCSLHDLGSVLGSQGKYEDAEAMYRRALAGKEDE